MTAVYGEGRETAGSNEVEIGLASKSVSLTIGNTTAEVNGRPVIMDQPPMIVEGRTMLPFRFIAENLGAEVAWNPDTETITAVWEGITVILRVGSQTWDNVTRTVIVRIETGPDGA